MLVNVHGSEFYLSYFYLTVFIVFDLQAMSHRYPDTAIVSPVSDVTSGSTVFARSLTLKFEF